MGGGSRERIIYGSPMGRIGETSDGRSWMRQEVLVKVEVEGEGVGPKKGWRIREIRP